MALTVTFTQADVDALKSAIATGTKTVAYADKTVTYQSTKEMLEALTFMLGETESEGGTNTTFVSFSRD